MVFAGKQVTGEFLALDLVTFAGDFAGDVILVDKVHEHIQIVTIHNNKSKLLIRLEKFTERFCVKLVVAKIQRSIDRLEGLEVDIDLAFLAFRGQDFTAVDDEAVRGDFVIELETLLGRGNGREHGLTVDTRFDVGGGAL